jgi:ABC-type sugar transport system substrate-binding protein
MLRPVSVVRTLAAAALIAAGGAVAQAEDATKVALVPGGPHPYFAAWEKAGRTPSAISSSAPPTTGFRKNGSSACRTRCLRAC